MLVLMEGLMTKSIITFYYSRKKIGLYLLLNFGLLALAALFTWSIFPDYAPVYLYALITCVISLFSTLFVFIFPMPLAVLDDNQIKIDHNNPLKWSQIKRLEIQDVECLGVNRSILKIIPTSLPNYKKSLMQKIADSSRFGMFSIPLYAMDEKSAKHITKLIKEHIKKQTEEKGKLAKVSPKKQETAKTTKKVTVSQKKQTKKKAPKKQMPKK